jgi:hypothetical protein
MEYKIHGMKISDALPEMLVAIMRLADGAYIPLDPENTDYANFKCALSSGADADGSEVILRDSSGNQMTGAQVEAFMVALP